MSAPNSERGPGALPRRTPDHNGRANTKDIESELLAGSSALASSYFSLTWAVVQRAKLTAHALMSKLKTSGYHKEGRLYMSRIKLIPTEPERRIFASESQG